MKIRPVKAESYTYARELLHQLYPKNELLEEKRFLQVLDDDHMHLIGAYEKEILVGMATLVVYHKLGGSVAVIEDVIVDSEFRGKGIGRKLMDALLDIARKNASFVDVHTRRDNASAFYQKLGFEKKDKDRAFHALRYYL